LHISLNFIIVDRNPLLQSELSCMVRTYFSLPFIKYSSYRKVLHIKVEYLNEVYMNKNSIRYRP